MNAVARQVKVYSKENKLAANEVLNFTVKTVVLGDESNDFWNDVSSGINFIVKKTGALYLYDLGGQVNFIGFTPEELEFVKRALDAALAQKEKDELS